MSDFTYGVSLNLSDYQITIDDYSNNPGKSLGIGTNQHGPYYKGAKLGSIWGFKTIGIAKTQEEMDAHLASANQNALGSKWMAGDIMYADLNGDGVVNTGENTADKSGDRVIIGNNTPRYQFGVTLDAQWKGFDIRVFFGAYSNAIIGPTAPYLPVRVPIISGRLPDWSSISTTSEPPTPPILSDLMSTPIIPDPTGEVARTSRCRTVIFRMPHMHV